MQIFIVHFVTKDDSPSVLRSAENISSFLNSRGVGGITRLVLNVNGSEGVS